MIIIAVNDITEAMGGDEASIYFEGDFASATIVKKDEGGIKHSALSSTTARHNVIPVTTRIYMH